MAGRMVERWWKGGGADTMDVGQRGVLVPHLPRVREVSRPNRLVLLRAEHAAHQLRWQIVHQRQKEERVHLALHRLCELRAPRTHGTRRDAIHLGVGLVPAEPRPPGCALFAAAMVAASSPAPAPGAARGSTAQTFPEARLKGGFTLLQQGIDRRDVWGGAGGG